MPKVDVWCVGDREVVNSELWNETMWDLIERNSTRGTQIKRCWTSNVHVAWQRYILFFQALIAHIISWCCTLMCMHERVCGKSACLSSSVLLLMVPLIYAYLLLLPRYHSSSGGCLRHWNGRQPLVPLHVVYCSRLLSCNSATTF